jgi:hypothetical protein
MSKLIIGLILLAVVFLFSLAPIARAQTCICYQPIPDGVKFAYRCELGCPCPEGATDPECEACEKLEMVFFNIECCSGDQDCLPPPDPSQ